MSRLFIKLLPIAVGIVTSCWSGAALAQEQEQIQSVDTGARPAVGTEVWASTDSDGTDVLKIMARALWNFEGREKYAGIAIEHAWFNPAIGKMDEADRVYLDVADHLNSAWRWKARIGTDGDTMLGSAELRRADWSKSLFIEREIVETSQGLTRKIYFTFAGASTDITIDPLSTLALTAGVQEFSGENERLHLRGRYVHVIKAMAGLSGQLDVRYYHSTKPGEFDYFSPRDFLRLVPIAQIRKFDQHGWMYLAAGGIGVQHTTGSKWKPARFAQLRLESPQSAQGFDAFAEALYSNDSFSGGPSYDYMMVRAGLTHRF